MRIANTHPKTGDQPEYLRWFNMLRLFERSSDRKVRRYLEDMPDYLRKDIGLCAGDDPADRDIMEMNANLRAGVLPTRPL